MEAGVASFESWEDKALTPNGVDSLDDSRQVTEWWEGREEEYGSGSGAEDNTVAWMVDGKILLVVAGRIVFAFVEEETDGVVDES